MQGDTQVIPGSTANYRSSKALLDLPDKKLD
jgi:hypothetical protein